MDFTLLNDARVKLEEMVDFFHEQYHPCDKPHTYRRTMRKEYLAVAKMRRRPAKKIRALIRKFDNRVHSIEHRIVSIHQPYIRPIVRGKAKAPVEFGAKYDVSIDEKGHARLEKIQFEPYNEGQII